MASSTRIRGSGAAVKTIALSKAEMPYGGEIVHPDLPVRDQAVADQEETTPRKLAALRLGPRYFGRVVGRRVFWWRDLGNTPQILYQSVQPKRLADAARSILPLLDQPGAAQAMTWPFLLSVAVALPLALRSNRIARQLKARKKLSDVRVRVAQNLG